LKWYFASRTKHISFIGKLSKFLESNGHSLVFDWSKLDALTPYNKNIEKSTALANQISKSLKETNIFVMLSDEGGTDMFIELGIVLERWMRGEKVDIYCVGRHNDRSLMQFHPGIKRVQKLRDVFLEQCPSLLHQTGADIIDDLEI